MNSASVRRAYLDYFIERGHTVIPPSSLVPREDPTTLFTGSGMQPLINNLLGAPHPSGDHLVDSQPCFRAEDVDEVGDNRHTTFFEMLGNWSLGAYFKDEQLPWYFDFITSVLKLDPQRIYTTAFAGSPEFDIPRDEHAVELWKSLFAKVGIDAKVVDIGSSDDGAAKGLQGGRIFYYDASKNWWTRAGKPEAMPPGEPGGPDAEVFYEFPQIEHDPAFGEKCHVHCDCGRFLEIGNSVFIEFVRTTSGFDQLPKQNVDFGGGLERMVMAVMDTPDVFRIDLLWPVVQHIESLSGKTYEEAQAPMRVIADHARAIVFLAANGVEPSNTAQGYVMRRFARRAIRQGLLLGIDEPFLGRLPRVLADAYGDYYSELSDDCERISGVLEREEAIFRKTLTRGTREFKRLAGEELKGAAIFTLFDTFGFPPELSIEEAERSNIPVDARWADEYKAKMTEQRDRSRTASAGTFKGGLADHSEATTKLHTATHLLYKALRLVLGEHVVQRGSNITAERLRFDFSHPQKMTPDEIARVQEIVNDAITHDYPMSFRELPTDEAFAQGALGAFGDKYGATVKVYTAGDPDGEWYSKEICGGPHVEHTGVLNKFRIVKEESSSSGVRRIKAVVE